jgi:predicted component of type VI protein secretion system
LLARLEEVLKSHVDYQPALNLRQRLNKPLKKGVVLTAPAEIPIYVFSQQQVILGRRDAGVPVDIAIDSRYVSRPHLTLTIEHDKIVLEDMKSTGGSYYNGEQFTTTGIQHDATITLGKVVDIELTLQHQGSSISGVEICEGEHQWFVVSRRVELASRHITITNNQGVLLLRSAQGVSILDGTEEIVLAGCTYRVEPVQEV